MAFPPRAMRHWLGDKRRQLHPQGLVSAKQQRLQRAFRAIQNPGDFAIVHLFVLMQQDGRALLLRQRRNRPPYDFRPVALDHVLVDPHFARREFPGRRIFAVCRRVERDPHPLVAVIADRIQRQIRRDAEEPRGEFRARRVLLPRSVDPQKYLLRQVLRGGRVPHHAVEEIHQRRAILLQQEVKGRIVPCLHVQHQLDVASGHGLHSLSNTHGAIKLRRAFMPWRVMPDPLPSSGRRVYAEAAALL